MPIQLPHIGEELIAAILESLAERGMLNQVICKRSGRTLKDDIRKVGLSDPITFHADDSTLVIHHDNSEYSCDGKQTVDVLCAGGDYAIAFESKLGTERMGATEFRKRFCVSCETSKHLDLRMRGNMVAALERKLPFSRPPQPSLIAKVDNARWTVAESWWLVVRRQVLDKWSKNKNFPVTENAKLLDFDTLAGLYGSRQEFDKLVRSVVGEDFAKGWDLQLNEP